LALLLLLLFLLLLSPPYLALHSCANQATHGVPCLDQLLLLLLLLCQSVDSCFWLGGYVDALHLSDEAGAMTVLAGAGVLLSCYNHSHQRGLTDVILLATAVHYLVERPG
jgi:hypothetical protein